MIDVAKDTAPRLLPITVIVTERNPLARAAIAALLTHEGCRVFQADSAKSAIALLNSTENFALLLADLEMTDWRAIVRHAVKTTAASIIAMEGTHPISAMYDLSERGIRACLQKPIIYKELQNVIKQLLRAQSAQKFTSENAVPSNPQVTAALG